MRLHPKIGANVLHICVSHGSSELSFMYQCKTFYVKKKFQATENQRLRKCAVGCCFVSIRLIRIIYSVRKLVDCYQGPAEQIPFVPKVLFLTLHSGVCLFYCPTMIDTNCQCCWFEYRPLNSFP